MHPRNTAKLSARSILKSSCSSISKNLRMTKDEGMWHYMLLPKMSSWTADLAHDPFWICQVWSRCARTRYAQHPYHIDHRQNSVMWARNTLLQRVSHYLIQELLVMDLLEVLQVDFAHRNLIVLSAGWRVRRRSKVCVWIKTKGYKDSRRSFTRWIRSRDR
jgi:hypothetical protein